MLPCRTIAGGDAVLYGWMVHICLCTFAVCIFKCRGLCNTANPAARTATTISSLTHATQNARRLRKVQFLFTFTDVDGSDGGYGWSWSSYFACYGFFVNIAKWPQFRCGRAGGRMFGLVVHVAAVDSVGGG